jgi:hypothetical protein
MRWILGLASALVISLCAAGLISSKELIDQSANILPAQPSEEKSYVVKDHTSGGITITSRLWSALIHPPADGGIVEDVSYRIGVSGIMYVMPRKHEKENIEYKIIVRKAAFDCQSKKAYVLDLRYFDADGNILYKDTNPLIVLEFEENTAPYTEYKFVCDYKFKQLPKPTSKQRMT